MFSIYTFESNGVEDPVGDRREGALGEARIRFLLQKEATQFQHPRHLDSDSEAGACLLCDTGPGTFFFPLSLDLHFLI